MIRANRPLADPHLDAGAVDGVESWCNAVDDVIIECGDRAPIARAWWASAVGRHPRIHFGNRFRRYDFTGNDFGCQLVDGHADFQRHQAVAEAERTFGHAQRDDARRELIVEDGLNGVEDRVVDVFHAVGENVLGREMALIVVGA